MSEKILIVDNEPDMLLLLSMLIRENTSYETMTTNNPLEALELIKKGGFSLVITEMKMPVLDGILLLDAIKRIDSNMPVIIMAKYGAVESALEAMRKGAFDFITKPFRKEQILFSIDKALKLTKLNKENKTLREWFKMADKKNLPHNILFAK